MPATDLTLAFADGEYRFALSLPQILELQRSCGAGIFTLYGRVMRGRILIEGELFSDARDCDAFLLDIYETIRLALIGGGEGIANGETVKVSPLRAKQLVETYIHPAPLKEAWEIAAAVLAAKVEGYSPAGTQKKSPPEADGLTVSMTERS